MHTRRNSRTDDVLPIIGAMQASKSLRPGYPDRLEIHGAKGTTIVTDDEIDLLPRTSLNLPLLEKGLYADSQNCAYAAVHTFIVLALLILLLSPVIILRTPTDIFHNIDIPVISIAWNYGGLNAEELEGRLTTPFEKTLTSLVDKISHIESTTRGDLKKRNIT